MMKSAGGYAFTEAPNVEAFVQQAEDFKHVEDALMGKVALVMGASLQADHPYPTIRARELLAWHNHPDH